MTVGRSKKTGKARGAVIYTRVSTEDQAQNGTSLDTQRDACRKKALALGLPIVAEYEDAGISGALFASRPGLQTALADIEGGHADTLLCYELSRLSRVVRDQQEIKARVEATGGRLVFCDMTFDETAEGDLNFVIQGGFKQYERQVIRNRTMAGKRRRAEEGQQPQRSRPPFGYHIVTNAQVAAGLYPPQMRGRYVTDEAKAPIAQRLFADYLRGLTLSQLAKTLNREAVPAPGGGRRWMPATIRVILTNPAYKGEPVSGRTKSGVDESRLSEFHRLTGRPITSPEVRRPTPLDKRLTLTAPALVTAAEWQAVQDRMEANRTMLKGNPRRALMLSGKTVCPHCGGRAILKYQKANGKRYSYLTCAEQRRANVLTGEKPCRGDLYPLAFMEECTARVIREVCERPDVVQAAEATYAEPKPDEAAPALRKELAALDEALRGVTEEQEAAVRAQIAGILAGASPDAYAGAFADIAARRKDLADRRGRVAALLARRAPAAPAAAPCVSDAIRRALDDVLRVLTDPDVAGVTKRDLLLPIVDRVVCHKDGVEVLFAPGLFHAERSEAEGQDLREQIDHTICIGINTHR